MLFKAFLQGIFDFYLGNKKEASFSKTPDDLMSKAWKMTGTSLSRTMRECTYYKK